MSREIKFRGKVKDGSRWVFGYLFFNGNDYGIVTNNHFPGDWEPVECETVGQFVGLPDKNGKDIYEGDIVTCNTKSEIKWKHKGSVEYLHSSAGFAINVGEEPASNTINDHYTFFWANENFEVIGNIYENK